MFTSWKYCAVGAAALAASQASAQTAGGQPAGATAAQHPQCYTLNRNQATLPYIQLTDPPPRTSADRVLLEAAVEKRIQAMGAVKITANGGAPRGYTRLLIDFVPCPGARAYSSEARTPLARFFVGKVANKVLTVKATVLPTDVAATTTLAKIVRDSTKKGDNWSTEVSNERRLLPFFRVDNNSVVQLTFEFSADREVRSTIAADAFDIISRAAAVISPTTALVTEENKARFNSASSFVDRSVSELMKVAVTEKLTKDVTLQRDDEIELARITLFAPPANSAVSRQSSAIGQWVVRATAVVESIFRPVEGTPGGTTPILSASAIMNFKVADNKTLQDALSERESVSGARDTLLKAQAEPAQKEAASALCRVLSVEADRLGLSPKDVGLTLWAYVATQMADETRRRHLKAECEKVEVYPGTSSGLRNMIS